MSDWIQGTEGTCPECPGCGATPCTSPTAPSATLVCDSISASLTKCGFSEFTSPSTPPKKYLTKSQTGIIETPMGGGPCTASCEYYKNTYTGDITYSAPVCSSSDTRSMLLHEELGALCTGTSPCTFNAAEGGFSADDHAGSGDYNGSLVWAINAVNPCLTGGSMAALTFTCAAPTVTQTQIDFTTACGGCASGNVVVSLSSEYTTADLITNAVAALPAYPGTFAGTCSSLRNLSSDEITYSIRRFKYKFTLPSLTGYTCYKITWDEGSTARSYLWNGTDTETPVYGPVSEPGTNGTVAISNVVYSCSCV